MKDTIEQIAELAAAAGIRRVSFSVNDAATETIAAMAGAVVRDTIYRHPTESYVIRAVEVRLAGVWVAAQSYGRPATAEELAGGESEWHEHREKAYQTRSPA